MTVKEYEPKVFTYTELKKMDLAYVGSPDRKLTLLNDPDWFYRLDADFIKWLSINEIEYECGFHEQHVFDSPDLHFIIRKKDDWIKFRIKYL